MKVDCSIFALSLVLYMIRTSPLTQNTLNRSCPQTLIHVRSKLETNMIRSYQRDDLMIYNQSFNLDALDVPCDKESDLLGFLQLNLHLLHPLVRQIQGILYMIANAMTMIDHSGYLVFSFLFDSKHEFVLYIGSKALIKFGDRLRFRCIQQYEAC